MRLLSFFLAICLVICFFAFYSAVEDKTDMAEIFTYIGETDVEIDGRTLFTEDDIKEWVNIKNSMGYYGESKCFLVDLKNNEDIIGEIKLMSSTEDAKSEYSEIVLSVFYSTHQVYYRINNMIIVTGNRTDIDNDNAFEFAKVLANRFDLKQPKKSYLPKGTLVKKPNESLTIKEVHSYFEKNNYEILEEKTVYGIADEEFVVFDDSFSSPLYAFAFYGDTAKDDAWLFIREELLSEDWMDQEGRLVIYYKNMVLTSYDHSWEKIIMKVNE